MHKISFSYFFFICLLNIHFAVMPHYCRPILSACGKSVLCAMRSAYARPRAMSTHRGIDKVCALYKEYWPIDNIQQQNKNQLWLDLQPTLDDLQERVNLDESVASREFRAIVIERQLRTVLAETRWILLQIWNLRKQRNMPSLGLSIEQAVFVCMLSQRLHAFITESNFVIQYAKTHQKSLVLYDGLLSFYSCRNDLPQHLSLAAAHRRLEELLPLLPYSDTAYNKSKYIMNVQHTRTLPRAFHIF